MKITLDIKKIIVVKRAFHMDVVSLNTTLPSPSPQIDPDPLELKFWVEKGKGESYARQHFPDIEIDIIDAEAA